MLQMPTSMKGLPKFVFGLTLCWSVVFLSRASGNNLKQQRVLHENGGKIVGGNEADRGEYPFQASLRSDWGHFCGGIVVSDSWILTAAHCVDGNQPGDFYVRLGDHFLYIDDSTQVDYEVDVIVVHEDYVPWPDINNDIALVHLARAIEFVAGSIEPVWLPYPDQEFFFSSTAIGWGITDEDGFQLSNALQEVQLDLVSDANCIAAYQDVPDFPPIRPTMICAGVPEGGKGSCGGDSGGPLLCTDLDTNQVIACGVTSWALGCARAGYPAVFSEIAAYRIWIGQIIGL